MSWTSRGLDLNVLLCAGQFTLTESHGYSTKSSGFVSILQCGIEGKPLYRIGLTLSCLELPSSRPASEPPRYFRRQHGPGTVLVFDPEFGEDGRCKEQDGATPFEVAFKIHRCVPQRISLESQSNLPVKV
ncbi:hypothetical protein BX600DRAFT_502231, partial [Xylariales sp. PMI_506]